MRIRKPAGLSTGGIVTITAISLLSGYYIWKPAFVQLQNERNAELRKQENEVHILLRRVMQMKYGTISLIVVGSSAFFLTCLGIKYKVMPQYRLYQLQEAKKYADFIYESESK